ncbi:hypothetical protein EYZ11_005802 [Aspergillus tanneri]|nr:hypothetical protein EYZ11_005802 [Aspergillus tanneri]
MTTTTTAYWGNGATNHKTHGDVDTYMFNLDQTTSQLLLDRANDALITQPMEIIQAAVLHSLVQQFPDQPAPVVFSEKPWP